MALTATIHNFDIELADSDRGVYESLALRVARRRAAATLVMSDGTQGVEPETRPCVPPLIASVRGRPAPPADVRRVGSRL